MRIPVEHAEPLPITGPLQIARLLKRHILNGLLEWGRLMHNHPSGDPTPSQADIQMTRSVIDVAKPLGIAVHDHIIVGKNGHASLKGLKLI